VDRVISKIRKSGSAELWVVLSDYTGPLRLDVREYFRADDGSYKPTRKGIAVDRSEIAGLIAALEALTDVTSPGTTAVAARRTGAEIVAGVREYQGHVYTEIRQFVPDGSDGWRPTGKGVTFKAGMIPAIIEAVELAEEQFAQADGSGSPGATNEPASAEAPPAAIAELFTECPSCGKPRRVQGAELCPDCARRKTRSS
jgi:hypothetical protein